MKRDGIHVRRRTDGPSRSQILLPDDEERQFELQFTFPYPVSGKTSICLAFDSYVDVTEYHTFLGICSHFGQIGSSTYESNAKQMDVLPDTGYGNVNWSSNCRSSSSGSSICDLDGPSVRRRT